MTWMVEGVGTIGGRIVVAWVAGVLLALGSFNHVIVVTLELIFGMRFGADIGAGDIAVELRDRRRRKHARRPAVRHADAHEPGDRLGRHRRPDGMILRTHHERTHAMSSADMLDTHPSGAPVDRSALAAAIDATLACSQTCTACADACLAEPDVAAMALCIRDDLDCADVCAATSRVLTRQTEWDGALKRARARGVHHRLYDVRGLLRRASRPPRSLPHLR